jgi:hypothetical protein
VRIVMIDGEGIIVRSEIKFEFDSDGRAISLVFRDRNGSILSVDIRDIAEIQVA